MWRRGYGYYRQWGLTKIRAFWPGQREKVAQCALLHAAHACLSQDPNVWLRTPAPTQSFLQTTTVLTADRHTSLGVSQAWRRLRIE